MSAVLFAVIDTHVSYWTMMFFIMSFVSGADIVYPVGNLHMANHFGEGAQALAGGVFMVSTRVRYLWLTIKRLLKSVPSARNLVRSGDYISVSIYNNGCICPISSFSVTYLASRIAGRIQDCSVGMLRCSSREPAHLHHRPSRSGDCRSEF